MIFVTLGTDLPFERLLKVVDAWAGENGVRDIFAQIGRGTWKPENIDSVPFLCPLEFKQRFQAAELIIAHAGMGTILSALQYGKPILIMPRRASLGEDRNEHQLATARRMHVMKKVHVAFNEMELQVHLQNLDGLVSSAMIGPYASQSLLDAIHQFIFSESC